MGYYSILEPLICKEYVNKHPVLIPYHRGGKRLHIGFQEFAEGISEHSQAVVNHLNEVKVKVVNVFRSRIKDNAEDAVEEAKVKERSYGSIMMERLTRSEDGRIDYMLQDKPFQHPYISALGSHTNYWRDLDTALFILKHLYRDIPEEPDQTDPASCEGSSKGNGLPILFFRNEAMDEDVPLTFSNDAMLKEFARKAKKTING
ncbi:hypothetical protein Taro_025048 [Colocasia esculenta]|uniref:DDHD domain-containing protein n=1 Tax=Colocasia esculenta TaxID=4460 RepID=A0A843VM80_COLES|nr:hypothetical protein [Colocasia esculenta]